MAWLLRFSRAYVGDVLYGVAAFVLFAMTSPRARASSIALAALVYCTAIELSQLYDAAWANDVRATRLGALVFGRGFLWSDLLCYTVGIGVAVAGELRYVRAVRGSTSARR